MIQPQEQQTVVVKYSMEWDKLRKQHSWKEVQVQGYVVDGLMLHEAITIHGERVEGYWQVSSINGLPACWYLAPFDDALRLFERLLTCGADWKTFCETGKATPETQVAHRLIREWAEELELREKEQDSDE